MIDKEHVIQRKNELYQSIRLRRKDMGLVLDFATGYKELPDQNFRLIPYRKNSLRLISTIEQIHQQIRELEKEYKLLNKMVIKLEEKSHDSQ